MCDTSSRRPPRLWANRSSALRFHRKNAAAPAGISCYPQFRGWDPHVADRSRKAHTSTGTASSDDKAIGSVCSIDAAGPTVTAGTDPGIATDTCIATDSGIASNSAVTTGANTGIATVTTGANTAVAPVPAETCKSGNQTRSAVTTVPAVATMSDDKSTHTTVATITAVNGRVSAGARER